MKIKRREMLKAALGAGALALLPGGRARDPREVCDVCAVGEGCGRVYLERGECPEDLEMQELMRPLDDLFRKVYENSGFPFCKAAP